MTDPTGVLQEIAVNVQIVNITAHNCRQRLSLALLGCKQAEAFEALELLLGSLHLLLENRMQLDTFMQQEGGA